MDLKHNAQRVAVFIDTQNLYHSAKNLHNGARVNFKEVLKSAVDGRQLIRAISYVISTESGEEQPFFEALEKLGIETKVKDLELQTNKDLIMKKAEIEVVELDVTAALHANVIDLKSVHSLNQKKYKLKNKKADILTEAFAALKSILSDDQKQKLESVYHSKGKDFHCVYGKANKKGSGSACPYANKYKGSGKGSVKGSQK